MADERQLIGTSFPGFSFQSEIEDGSRLGSATAKEFRFLYANLEAFLRAAGFNADGSVNNIIANSLTLVQNHNTILPPNVGGAQQPGTVFTVSAGGAASPFSGGGDCCSEVGVGDLLFSGFGDAPVKVYSPAGTAKAALAGNPRFGTAGCLGLVQLASGVWAVTGTSSPGPTDPAVYAAADLAFIAGQDFQAHSIAAHGNDWWCGSYEVSPFTLDNLIYKLSAAGAVVATFNLNVSYFPDFMCIGVSPDGATAYVGRRNSGVSDVLAFDLAGGTNAAFVTEATFSIRDNAIHVLPSGNVLIGWKKSSAEGFVRLYDPAGATVATYTLPGTGVSPICVARGAATGASFWASYYCEADTFSGVRLAEIDVLSGAVLRSFDPEDGTFEFDGPFSVVRTPPTA